MPDTPAPEKHEFKAEVSAVLRLVTNSLYTHREIFLRELVSNASDALDKARFAALTDTSLNGQELTPEIHITIDKANNRLIVEDTGIGMSREEAATNLGTIAQSGTLQFMQKIATQQAEGKRPDLGLIGQFGVGFYSAFMVSERIEVTTRSAHQDASAVRWSSIGEGGFELQAAEKAERGTRIELYLKDDAKEFLERSRIESIIRRYSNFVMYPIQLQELGDAQEAAPESVKQINEVGAFWTRDPKDLGDEAYQEFYRHVMGGFVLPGDQPLARLHVALDAPIQFRAVLFVPGRRPMDLFAEDSRHLQLYARRVLVMENCDKLLPVYLRFIRGVVDSEDLPLNVSREMLQDHASLAAIRRQLTRKVLKLLQEKADTEPEAYAKIWEEFGVFLKEGLHTDNAHKSELTDLLRFASTANDDGRVSLREYVAAMPEGQDAIYYITGETAADLRRSPHLEACKSRGYAVLLMTDAVDEWVMQDLDEVDGKPFRSVTGSELSLPEGHAQTEAATPAAEPAELEPLLERARSVLSERVKDVRRSTRLAQSASCLVDAEGGLGHNMERILKMAGRDVQARPRVLELNPSHPFVQEAARRAREQPAAGEGGAQAGTDELSLFIELLHDRAHIAEGEVPDPAGMAERLQAVLDKLVSPAV